MIFANRQAVQSAVGEWDSDCFRLRSADPFAVAEEPAMNARGLQSFMAEVAAAIRESERHHNKIAFLHVAHFGTNRLDDADRFVTHSTSIWRGRQFLVRPKIAAADAGS